MGYVISQNSADCYVELEYGVAVVQNLADHARVHRCDGKKGYLNVGWW